MDSFQTLAPKLSHRMSVRGLHSQVPINPTNCCKQLTLFSQHHKIQQFEPNTQNPFNITNQHNHSPRYKQKRNTLPCQIQTFKRTQYIHALLSPTYIPSNNRKINFTYKSPTNHNNSQSTISLSKTATYNRFNGNYIGFSSKLEIKKLANKLCSKQHSFFYAPKTQSLAQSFYQQNTSSSKIIELNEGFNSFIRDRSKDSHYKQNCESRTASTIATQSFFNENRKSDFSTTDNINSSQTNLLQNTSFCKGNLLDRIPTSKQLGKTVILTNNEYSFGGILGSINQISQQKARQQQQRHNSLPFTRECEMRKWNNHVKCLIERQDTQDLKVSIHCGPEVRAEKHKFQLLHDFGREIKESSIQYTQ